MATVAYLTAYDTAGDYRHRDLYNRHHYQVSSGNVVHASYITSNGTAYNASVVQSQLSGTAGLLRVFVKGDTGSTITTSTDTPIYTATSSTLTVNGALVANSSAAIAGTLSVSNDATLSANLTVAGNTTLSGAVTVNSDALFTSDVYIAGSAYIYGDVDVVGNLAVESSQLLIASNVSSYDTAGLYIGANVTSPTASLIYGQSSAKSGGGAMVINVPLVYQGNSTTAEIGTSGTVTVYNSSTKTQFVQMGNSTVSFSDLWRLRYDETTRKLEFENRANTSASWTTMLSVNPTT
jgi:hypothetical protein